MVTSQCDPILRGVCTAFLCNFARIAASVDERLQADSGRAGMSIMAFALNNV